MRLHSLIPLIAAVANLLIGTLVLRRGMRDRVHRAFAWSTLTIAGWNLAIFSLYYFPSAEEAEWWSRIFRTGICFAPIAVFHFTSLLVGATGGAWLILLVGGYVAAAVLAVLDLRGDLVARVSPHTWGWYIEPTRLYSLLTALLLLYIGLCVHRTWRAYRNPSSARHRVQAKFWLLGLALQAPLTLTNLLPAYGINIYPLGNFGNVLFTGIVAYAIVRHRLMDVDYVVRKGVSFALAAVAVVLPGGLGIAALSRELSAQDPLLLATAAATLALVASILIPTLQHALETRLQRAFFPHRYDYRRRLGDLAGAVVHLLDEQRLVQRLGSELAELFDVDGCQVFLRDERTAQLALAYPPHAAGSVDGPLAHCLDRLTEPVLAAELDPDAEALFRAQGWEVGVPLRTGNRLTGLVALGQKRDFGIFSIEDLRLLGSVASGASVALQNMNLSRQLRRSEMVLEKANRLSSLGMLAAGIAHEIRNPLVAVKTFLDLLPQRLDDRDFLTHFRDLSLGELKRVTNLIADLLALGKSTTAARRAVEAASSLEPVVRLMESTARNRKVELVSRVGDRVPEIWADPDQLKQIVLNLILNAIEASPAGGQVTLDIRKGEEGTVVLEVRDQGPGIPAEQQEHIFDPFFTTKETGTGLGLALVHQMVVEHGGSIDVESAPGRGTAFRVALPTADVALAPTGT
jgi:signal transduction histidine kinase